MVSDLHPCQLHDMSNFADDTFSSLWGLGFEWSIGLSPSDQRDEKSRQIPLKIIPFSESKYEAPAAIERLEALGKYGGRGAEYLD